MNKQKLSIVLASCSLLALCGSASAAGSSSTVLNVVAYVSSSCQISANSVNFGSYDPASPNAGTATGGITLACVKGSNPIVTLDFGQNANGSIRAMKGNNTEVLEYQLYQPANNTAGTACTFNESVVWGDTGTERFVVTTSPGILPRIYNICGVIPPGQDVATDFYQDKVMAQVDF